MAAKIIPDSIRDVLDYDPESGQFWWKPKPAGYLNPQGYVVIRHNNVGYLAHRVAHFLVTGEQPNIVDHINNDTADNRIANLRSVTPSQNSFNLSKQTGVCWVTANDGTRKARAFYSRRQLYTGKSILIAWFRRIMAERADHPIGLPSPS